MRNRYAILIYCASLAAGIGAGFMPGDHKPKSLAHGQAIERIIERADKAEIAKLLERHPDLNARDKSERSLLAIAMQNCEWAQYANEHGRKDGDALLAKHRDIVCMLLDAGADPNEGNGFLGYALQIADPELMRILVKHGAVASYEKKVDYSVYDFRLSTDRMEDFEECLNIAIKVGYDLNRHDSNGRTKMHAIAQRIYKPTARLEKAVRIMISHGLDINAADCLGLTPYDYAGNEEAQRWLATLGAKPSR